MRLRSFWPSILWAILIIVLSTASGKSFPSADWMEWFKLDKWIHAFLYFVLFVLLYIPCVVRRNDLSLFIRLALILTPILLGVMLELIQTLLPDRSGDIPDAVANTVGVLFGLIFIKMFFKKWPWENLTEGAVDPSDGTV